MKRASFQINVWKRNHEQYPEIILSIYHCVYINVDSCKLEPLWFDVEVIPRVLVEFLAEIEIDERRRGEGR